MKGTFKTFMTKDKTDFATVHGGEVFTCDNPIMFLAPEATMEIATKIFPKNVIERIQIVEVEYKVKG